MKPSLMLVLAALSSSAPAFAGECVRGEAFARWDARSLTVGNGRFESRLFVKGGVLRMASLVEGGLERLRGGEGKTSDPFVVAEADGGWSAAGDRELAVSVSSGGRTAVVRVWPRASGPVVEQPPAEPLPSAPGEREWGARVFSFGWSGFKSLGGCGDQVEFAAPHLVARAYTPIDRTDIRAELLDEREFAMPTCETMTYLRCSALDVRETLTGRGVVFLKLAPMPASRVDPGAVDFAVNPSGRGVLAVPTGYPLATLGYSGGEVGRLRALRDFHRSLWPRRAGRDGVLLSNTWGDGNRDSRINEKFLLGEIAAAADIGVEVVQIDDGWQKGRSANSSQSNGKGVWNGYWAADPEFWNPDPVRFPGGLKPLVDAAAAKGVAMGLWFGPDSSGDAANWDRDADCLLLFYRQFGIRHFKIDSLKLHTQTAFVRNRSFFSKMLRESGGAMCFDLDCTAEVRPGFLGGMPVGPLFAENRYAFRKRDWRVYYPHQTLRSIWTLAKVIDPVRLRMEFLNPAKKDELYGADPLRPAAWPADALFAITMSASPLAWMELSDVPEDVRCKWRPLIAAWKRERDRFHDCVLVPVGAKPDGEAWTGFVSVADDGGGYALIFREGSAVSDWRLDLRGFFGRQALAASVLSGGGEASVADGGLNVRISDRFGYVWLSLSAVRQPGR